MLSARQALTFHKRVAYLILIFAVGHAFFHCLNYGFAVQNTMALFGIWPWASGTTIFVIMALMYGAAMPNVKHFQFELFWNTHHLFVLFFVLLVAHGRTGLNPNYWKWLIVPMTIYIAERIYRHRSAYRSVTLTSVNNMGKVSNIDTFGYGPVALTGCGDRCCASRSREMVRSLTDTRRASTCS